MENKTSIYFIKYRANENLIGILDYQLHTNFKIAVIHCRLPLILWLCESLTISFNYSNCIVLFSTIDNDRLFI